MAGADRWLVPSADCRCPTVLSRWCEQRAAAAYGRQPVPGGASCRCGAAWPRCDRGVGDDRCPMLRAAAAWCGGAGGLRRMGMGGQAQRSSATPVPLRRVRGWPDGRIGSARVRARVMEWRGLYTWSGMEVWAGPLAALG
jgi:hypothetical protein